MTKEWTELMSNNTFHENKDGSIERYKSRFVACGYSQIKGVDYTKYFSATLRSSSLRTMIALAA
eukprot:1824899-Prymnesium_polylepis.1